MCLFIDFKAKIHSDEDAQDQEYSELESSSSDLKETDSSPDGKRRRVSYNVHQESSGSAEVMGETKEMKELLQDLVKRGQKMDERVQRLEEVISGGTTSRGQQVTYVKRSTHTTIFIQY